MSDVTCECTAKYGPDAHASACPVAQAMYPTAGQVHPAVAATPDVTVPDPTVDPSSPGFTSIWLPMPNDYRKLLTDMYGFLRATVDDPTGTFPKNEKAFASTILCGGLLNLMNQIKQSQQAQKQVQAPPEPLIVLP